MPAHPFPTIPQDAGFAGALRFSLRSLAAGLLTALFAVFPLVVAAFTLGRSGPVAWAGSRAFAGLARVLCPILGLRVRVDGAVPEGPCVIAPNHLSYLDVLVLARTGPALFVSRADVRGWPGIGLAARLGGTIWVDRSRKRDASRAGAAIGDALGGGHRVVVFLEGGASDGTAGVLPFRSSLLEPVCNRGLPAAAARISYTLPEDPGASVAQVVAWADDTPFAGHARRLLALRRIDAVVRFSSPRTGAGRKQLAAALREDCAS